MKNPVRVVIVYHNDINVLLATLCCICLIKAWRISACRSILRWYSQQRYTINWTVMDKTNYEANCIFRRVNSTQYLFLKNYISVMHSGLKQITSYHNMYNLGSYSYIDLVAMIEHIGPSFTQGHLCFLHFKTTKYGTRWMTPW